MTIGDPRYGSADPSAYGRPIAQGEASAAQRTGSGRRIARADTGTVALALGGMAMYWLMPALMARGRRGKRVVRPARRPRRTPPPENPEP